VTSKPSVPFLCSHNSARSQMAEAILRSHAGERFAVHSTGLQPTTIHPLTVEVMREAGYDLSGHTAKGVERIAPTIGFRSRGLEVRISGVRQAVPPRMESIECEIIFDTNENASRLALLHENVNRFGTGFNAIAPGTHFTGVIPRANTRSEP